MFTEKSQLARKARELFLGALFGAGLLIGTAQAADDMRLHYSVYLGGLPLGKVDVELSQSDNSYVIRSAATTNRNFDWLVTWVASGETQGRVALGEFLPRQHHHTSKWRDKERIVTMQYAPDGTVKVEKTGGRPPAAGELTPIDPASLTDSIDPMSAILTVMHRLERGEGCQTTLPVFDGHRRYDVTLTDVPARTFRASAYSVFSGMATGCRVEFTPMGGFPVNQTVDQKNHQAVVWVADPAGDGRIVPVRLQRTTQFGAMEIHLDSYGAGDIRIVSPNAR